MSKFYIVDTSKSQGGKSPVVLFETTSQLVGYLDGACKRNFGQSRKQFMSSVEELGFGSDDSDGRNFVEQMEQYFNIGVIRNDSTPMKCNVFDADRFSKLKDTHGN